ncbi:HAMP domain-containing histidine kinase [Methylocystis sp. WRRC1]|uniref:sensor histidine kinase n=1 Tax=Methylocystis sp. WRRC1 TaxID=1732014 RepID=UPI001D153806|nr:HAMP domain-containing sensor histidine kinase [Methylocystis sp. WRRC1]MCC3245362.1 HAMP domain-containing histidine kinase [Methylocystis sp. WRRC1]
MSGSDVNLDEGGLAARRIAADPAFSALDASGAPIVAASGDPLAVVYLNASARHIFGEDAERLGARLFFGDEPGARRLAELVESVRHGAALRLERLRFDLGDEPRTITVLCRKLAGEDGAPCFVIAALGVRAEAPQALSAPPAPAPASAPVASGGLSAATIALRERLVARHGARAPRFLWKTDAAGRFIDITHVLADVVGEESADILGRPVDEVARSFSLDSALTQAIAAQKSWSGVDVDWPLENLSERVPVTLGALPTTDSDRRFAGFQGYGVLHLSRAYVVPGQQAGAGAAPPPEKEKPPPSAPAPERDDIGYRADNVVPLRPSAATPRIEEPRDPAADATLTASEQSAFDEIARALLAGDASGDDAAGTPADAPEETESAPAEAEPAAAPRARDRTVEEVLDRLPVGVLIARGADTLFVNRTLLDYLGYADRAAFDTYGGLARMFFGRGPGEPNGHAGPAAVQSSDGERLDVDVHLQTLEWEGEAATLLTLRRNHHRPRGPDESALALAREMEARLARVRANNNLLRAVLESDGSAIAIVGDDGLIESATAGFAALFGAETGAFDGLPLASLFAAQEGRTIAGLISRVKSEQNETARLTARARGVPIEASLQRLPVGAGKICVRLKEPAADRRNDELEAARVAAEHASAAKSDFLARVSHEIRTPLNAIIGFAEVMMEERFGPIGSERYKEYLKDVHASGTHVLSLVNDLLDLSKIEAGKLELSFERVDANAIISECVSIMQTQANQGRVVVRLALAQRLPPIRADERSLKQILLNLLSNAVKFNEPGGQVIVSTALTEAGYVVIRVKDTGVGMSDDEVETALEPFKQIATSRKVRGTGLGLPLTKALIEANHASFTIKSRKNEGTLIEVAFPPPQVLAAE